MRMKLVRVETCDERSAAHSSWLLAHRRHEEVERDLVDEDPGDADEREFARAEEGSEEATDPRPAVPACGALGVRLGLRHRSLGTGGRPRHRNRAPNGASNRGAQRKRPKEPIGPLVRFRRCKHLRLGSIVPRSVVVAADASTCVAAVGPSWPLRAKPTIRAARAALAMGLSTNLAAGRPFASALSTVRPRPRPGDPSGGGQRSSGRRGRQRSSRQPSPWLGARPTESQRPRQGLRSPRSAALRGPGEGQGNARRNRRSSAESPESKLQRSQGFGPSAPSGKTNYDPPRPHPGYRLIHDLRRFARPESRRFSTARPPCRRRAAERSAGAGRVSWTASRVTGRRCRRSPDRADPDPAGARKRPKEPIDPLVRGRRCKHLRLGSIVPRSVLVAADASTCDAAVGPSWPLRARPTIRAAGSRWLWGYPRTWRLGRHSRARCPRSVHGPDRPDACGAGELSARAARRSGRAGRPGRPRRGAPRRTSGAQAPTDRRPARTSRQRRSSTRLTSHSAGCGSSRVVDPAGPSTRRSRRRRPRPASDPSAIAAAAGDATTNRATPVGPQAKPGDGSPSGVTTLPCRMPSAGVGWSVSRPGRRRHLQATPGVRPARSRQERPDDGRRRAIATRASGARADRPRPTRRRLAGREVRPPAEPDRLESPRSGPAASAARRRDRLELAGERRRDPTRGRARRRRDSRCRPLRARAPGRAGRRRRTAGRDRCRPTARRGPPPARSGAHRARTRSPR